MSFGDFFNRGSQNLNRDRGAFTRMLPSVLTDIATTPEVFRNFRRHWAVCITARYPAHKLRPGEIDMKAPSQFLLPILRVH